MVAPVYNPLGPLTGAHDLRIDVLCKTDTCSFFFVHWHFLNHPNAQPVQEGPAGVKCSQHTSQAQNPEQYLHKLPICVFAGKWPPVHYDGFPH